MQKELPRNQLKLSNAIADELKEMIFKNKVDSNSRFYSEREIVEKWSCSRATAREAVLLLEFEGLIVSKPGPGGGIFVREPDTTSVIRSFSSLINFNSINRKELMETQMELETLCTGLAAERATPEDIECIAEVMQECEVNLREQRNAQAKNVEFHMAIASAAQNRVLWLLMKVLEPIIYENNRSYVYTNEQLDQVIQVHQRIFDAIANRDADAAMRRMRRHMKEFQKIAFYRDEVNG